jgi:hypothetical protein
MERSDFCKKLLSAKIVRGCTHVKTEIPESPVCNGKAGRFKVKY